MAVGRVAKIDAGSSLTPVSDALQAIDQERAGLVEAVRQARASGCSWTQIGRILDVSRQAAQQRFGPFLDESAGGELTRQPVPVPVLVPKFDFSAMATMTDEQLVAAAGRLPRDEKLVDPYLRAQREAIILTLYRRDWTQRRIATVIGKTNQRVSQIVAGYYSRQEKEWEEERARRNGGR